MDSDTPLVVNLEVAVPRINLAINGRRSRQEEELLTEQHTESGDDEELEQVCLVAVGLQGGSSPLQEREQRQSIAGDVSARMNHALRFLLFRIPMLAPAGGQTFLLQVLRKSNAHLDAKRRKRTNTKENNGLYEPFHITDATTFSIEFRPLDGSTEVTSAVARPIPGLNQIIIYLDDEGTPASYSIDGAAS